MLMSMKPLLRHTKVFTMLKVEVTGANFFYILLVKEEDFEAFENQVTAGITNFVTLDGYYDNADRTPLYITMSIDCIESFVKELKHA